MNKITTKKANIISGHISKSQIAELLQISRSHFYKLMETHGWKNYQIVIIDNIHNKISTCSKVSKVCIEDNKLCIYSVEKTPVKKLIYPI